MNDQTIKSWITMAAGFARLLYVLSVLNACCTVLACFALLVSVAGVPFIPAVIVGAVMFHGLVHVMRLLVAIAWAVVDTRTATGSAFAQMEEINATTLAHYEFAKTEARRV